jgi:hypothetical protein
MLHGLLDTLTTRYIVTLLHVTRTTRYIITLLHDTQSTRFMRALLRTRFIDYTKNHTAISQYTDYTMHSNINTQYTAYYTIFTLPQNDLRNHYTPKKYIHYTLHCTLRQHTYIVAPPLDTQTITRPLHYYGTQKLWHVCSLTLLHDKQTIKHWIVTLLNDTRTITFTLLRDTDTVYTNWHFTITSLQHVLLLKACVFTSYH